MERIGYQAAGEESLTQDSEVSRDWPEQEALTPLAWSGHSSGGAAGVHGPVTCEQLEPQVYPV